MVISWRFLLKSEAAPGANDVESGSSNILIYHTLRRTESKYSGEGAVILAHQTGLSRLIPLVR